MKPFPKVLLLFMAVDWPIYMRRPMVFALTESAAAHDCTVVAVNRPLCPISTGITKRHRFNELFKPAGLEQMADNLYLFSPTYAIYDSIANAFAPLEKLNLAAIRSSYHKLEKRLGRAEPNPIIWFNHPQQGWAMNLFDHSFNVFELYDNLADNAGHTPEALRKLETRMRGRTDLLLTTSQKIHDAYSRHYKNAIMFGNGLSRAAFDLLSDDAVEPIPSIAAIPSPRIGYAGMISERLDWNLITGLAKKRPDWQFVFAGHVSDPAIPTRHAEFANIHFPGEFAHKDVPAVLKSLDVGLLPYLDNPFFHFLNPLKFYEFAAAGLASVSSNINELRQYPDDFVKVVPNVAAIWEEAIEKMLARDRGESRKAGRDIARRFVWEDMTADLLDRIAAML